MELSTVVLTSADIDQLSMMWGPERIVDMLWFPLIVLLLSSTLVLIVASMTSWIVRELRPKREATSSRRSVALPSSY